ncbi:MAG TPA: hypothetical protein G4O00_06230 [Thermoflexia bacterium]|nr:hypothetical protein [Thermoflexia bacterium]
MPAELRSRRTFWHTAWEIAAEDVALAVVLFVLAGCWVVLLLVPQAPSDPLSLGRWSAEIEDRFGPLTALFRALGLFSLLDSPFYRILLATLAFLLLVRTVAWMERLWLGRRVIRGAGEWSPVNGGTLEEMGRWLTRRGYRTRRAVKGHVLQADRWPWAEAVMVLAHLGPLLLLAGFLIGEIGGWKAEGVIGEVGRTVTGPGGRTFALVETSAGWVADQPGVQIYVTGVGPELTVSAVDAEGNALGLQQAAGEPLSPTLRFRLTEREPDAYFAVPEAGLIVRIAPESEPVLQPETDLRVQVFRSPSGNLVWEETIGETTSNLDVEGIRVRIEQGAYPVLLAVHDPGRWLKVLGLVMTGIGVLGWGLWPVRRLWLRVDQGQPVGVGDLPQEWVGRGREGWQLARAVAGVTSAFVIGAAFWSLAHSGVLWQGSPFQMVLTLLTAIGVGICLIFSGRKEGARAR